MKAFLNDEQVRQTYLKRVRDHAAADEIVKGLYWQEGKGSAVGCTIHSGNHKAYETELGIPEWIARLEDKLFENMTNERAKVWPVQFLEAVHVGADLKKIRVPFIVFLMRENLRSMDACVFDREANPDVVRALDGSKAAIHMMIEAQESGDAEMISAAGSAAKSAGSAAWSTEESAAWAAAWSAWSAQSAAESAVESAARSMYERYADKLLELIRECE